VEVRGKLIGRLSRGYRQRVGLAQAMLHNPPVLILDEPTVGLDPRQIIEVRELIRDLAGDHTVLLSTHILPEVSMLCSRVVIIDHGRVVAEDRPEHMTRALRGGERLVLEVEGLPEPVAERLRGVRGVASVQIDEPSEIRTSEEGAPHPPEAEPLNPCRLIVQTEPSDDVSARRTRRTLAHAVVAGGDGLLELRAERLTLEDVFVRLTTTEPI
jgi:ABC-2 type transport system ATP-binding protein